MTSAFPNWGVSRIHRQLRRGQAGFLLTDPGSSNGALVNGELVTRRDLVTGDEISIQGFTLTVEILGRRNDPLLPKSAATGVGGDTGYWPNSKGFMA